VHLLSAYDTSTGIVLAQVQIAATHNCPAVFATLRNTAIGYHHTNGATNIAEATRYANHRPHDLIDAVTTGKPTMTRSNPTTQ
jgi:hypothetical protein